MPTRATRDDCSKQWSASAGAWLRTPRFSRILHCYVVIERRDAIQPAFDALLGIVDQVLPVDRSIAERAKQIVLGYPRLSARDAVHLAVMQHHRVEQIMTFDSGFDGFPGITRLS